MEWEMDAGAYKRVELQKQPKPAEISTPEMKYWRQFKTITMTKAYAAVHCVTFSPIAPYDLAVTNSTRVQIYGVRGKAPKKTISRFKDVVYCTAFRSDGKLIVRPQPWLLPMQSCSGCDGRACRLAVERKRM
eukprot:545596-Rhodomonas_salina.3